MRCWMPTATPQDPTLALFALRYGLHSLMIALSGSPRSYCQKMRRYSPCEPVSELMPALVPLTTDFERKQCAVEELLSASRTTLVHKGA